MKQQETITILCKKPITPENILLIKQLNTPNVEITFNNQLNLLHNNTQLIYAIPLFEKDDIIFGAQKLLNTVNAINSITILNLFILANLHKKNKKNALVAIVNRLKVKILTIINKKQENLKNLFFIKGKLGLLIKN